mgnify:FL=1
MLLQDAAKKLSLKGTAHSTKPLDEKYKTVKINSNKLDRLDEMHKAADMGILKEGVEGK